MGDPHCKWVRDRLPLLAGDELFGTERRRVERHLICCTTCRAHRDALGHALDALHAASAESPTRLDAPTLWPALARQIRESRQPAPARSWISALTWPRLGLAVGLLVALGLSAATRYQMASANARIRQAATPLPHPPIAARLAPAPTVAPVVRPSPERVAQPESVAESSPPARYDYMLDHGTPMGPDSADSKTRSSY
jgi:anti-sigma factor RsiW